MRAQLTRRSQSDFFARSDAFRNFADNVPSSLAFNEALLTSNNDPSTWELASGVLDIPADATYLAIMLRVTENVVNDTTNEFAGHYADNVMVSFVPEPSSLLLLGLSVVGSMGLRTRSYNQLRASLCSIGGYLPRTLRIPRDTTSGFKNRHRLLAGFTIISPHFCGCQQGQDR